MILNYTPALQGASSDYITAHCVRMTLARVSIQLKLLSIICARSGAGLLTLVVWLRCKQTMVVRIHLQYITKKWSFYSKLVRHLGS